MPLLKYCNLGNKFCLILPFLGPRCDRPLGMKNGRIHSNQITASSSWDRNHGPGNARLHWRKSRARVGAWSARHNNHYQFLQVYFKRPARVVKIATQGRQDARQWVTKYFVAYSQDGANFAEYKENSNRKVRWVACMILHLVLTIGSTEGADFNHLNQF